MLPTHHRLVQGLAVFLNNRAMLGLKLAVVPCLLLSQFTLASQQKRIEFHEMYPISPRDFRAWGTLHGQAWKFVDYHDEQQQRPDKKRDDINDFVVPDDTFICLMDVRQRTAQTKPPETYTKGFRGLVPLWALPHQPSAEMLGPFPGSQAARSDVDSDTEEGEPSEEHSEDYA